MFNKNFYPSPEKVRELLLHKLYLNGSRVLEPSAGKGDLADAVMAQNDIYNKNTVDVIEIEAELCSILQGKGYAVVGYDFLEYHSYTEYDAIVMNPPFDAGDKHVIHAIRLAEQQVFHSCKIRAIVNAETIRNPYSVQRQELHYLLNKYQAEITYHEGLFKDAERQTDVETAIISLTVDPVRSRVSDTYSDIISNIEQSFESEQLEHSLSTVVQSQELQERVADIKGLVKQYQYHIRLLRSRYEADRAVGYLENLIGNDDRYRFSSEPSKLTDINADIERVRGKYWEAILRTGEFAEKLTEYGRQQLRKQIEQSSKLEITYNNIEMLLLAVMQNSGSILMDSCLALFERITKHHQREFSTNIHYYTGWKSNDAFKINKKFILPFRTTWGHFDDSDMGAGYKHVNSVRTIEYNYEHVKFEVRNFITDLVRMLQLLKPSVSPEFETVQLGEFENETVRFKMFKKGTVHFWIKDLELLEQFNVLCGQHYNWIPADEEIRESAEAKQFMQKEFKQYLKIKQLN